MIKNIKTKRTHDRIYLKENRKERPREFFNFINDHLLPMIKPGTVLRILDVGCATGDFLYFLNKLYPQAELSGIDVMPELITRAKKEFSLAKYTTGDILSGKNLPKIKYNFIFMSGVHQIFDEYKLWINNLLKLTKKGGAIFVFGMFNNEDVDTLMRCRLSGNLGPWQSGWNLFSKKTIGDYLKNKKIKFRFYDFNVGIDIEKHISDPLRSWTIMLKNGKRMIVNGTGVIHTLSLLEIKP